MGWVGDAKLFECDPTFATAGQLLEAIKGKSENYYDPFELREEEKNLPVAEIARLMERNGKSFDLEDKRKTRED